MVLPTILYNFQCVVYLLVRPALPLVFLFATGIFLGYLQKG